MIMEAGKPLLLPANPVFIWGSLVAAFLLEVLQTLVTGSRSAWTPDWVAVVLVFWSVHQPQRIGIGAAFVFGLMVDVHQVALLGQHALAYTVLIYCAIMIHRRLLWFGVVGQMLQVFPLFLAAQLVEVAVRLVLGGDWPVWDVLLSPLIETLLWPVLTWLLLAPQRRPPDPDENRPL